MYEIKGSERVYKCAITGTILTEAKHINLSLHYLEQVIVCLGQENTSHIPYRNSLLTAILRDSLGGNCLTTMLTTLSVSVSNLEETISSCRFAQRVALIQNDVRLILERDMYSENELLKMENERLKERIDTLTRQHNELIENDKIKNAQSIIYESPKQQLSTNCSQTCVKNFEYYKNLVFERDQKISLLINMLNQVNEVQKKRKNKKKEPVVHNLKNVLKGEMNSNNNHVSMKFNSETTEYENGSTVNKIKTRKKSKKNKTKVNDKGSLIESMLPSLKLGEAFDNEEKLITRAENSTGVINSERSANLNDKSIRLVSGQKQLQPGKNKDKTITEKCTDIDLNSSRSVSILAASSPRYKCVEIEIADGDLNKDININKRKLVGRYNVAHINSMKSISLQTNLNYFSKFTSSDVISKNSKFVQTCPNSCTKFVETENSIMSNVSIQTNSNNYSKSPSINSEIKNESIQVGSNYIGRKVMQKAIETYVPSKKVASIQTMSVYENKETETNPYLNIVDFFEKENMNNNISCNVRSKSIDNPKVKSILLNDQLDRIKFNSSTTRDSQLKLAENTTNFNKNIIPMKFENAEATFSKMNLTEIDISNLSEDENFDQSLKSTGKNQQNFDKEDNVLEQERSKTVIQLIENFQKDLDATMDMIISSENQNSSLCYKDNLSTLNCGSKIENNLTDRSTNSNDSKMLDLNDNKPEKNSPLNSPFVTDSSLPLTGDPEIDEEIIAYFKTKRAACKR